MMGWAFAVEVKGNAGHQLDGTVGDRTRVIPSVAKFSRRTRLFEAIGYCFAKAKGHLGKSERLRGAFQPGSPL